MAKCTTVYVGDKQTNVKNIDYINSNQDKTTVAIFLNQSGYDVGRSKRATVTNAKNGTTFYIKNTSDEIVYTGTIEFQIADFTEFNVIGEYYLNVGSINSYNFKIDNNYIATISQRPALDFMAQSRQDVFNTGGNTGYAWRDSHQFSFELHGLCMQYMSNPSYYEGLPYSIPEIDTCEYTELQTQNEPDIIWLMKFAATRYYKWYTDKGINPHALIKCQLPYFLYLYPSINNYVTEEFYTQIRNFAIEVWGLTNCNKSWYEVDGGFDNDLYKTQSKIGTEKGQLPPGYAIMPNLLMYKIAVRDGLDAEVQTKFYNAFYNNCKWLIDNVDLDNPANSKGQRMSEYITMTGLTYAYETNPELCPPNTLEKIERMADVIISRSVNMWDFRQYSTERDITGSKTTQWTIGTLNEVGNIAGLPAICFSIARVITDTNKKRRLKEIAMAHIDTVFGRNPYGRHYGYDAPTEIEGVDLGWFKKYSGGFGDLGSCTGRLDGSPKEVAYPFDANSDYGYTEGWVAFNSAWNMTLAYLNGENENITDGLDIFSK